MQQENASPSRQAKRSSSDAQEDVTVVIPAYNCHGTIGAAVSSAYASHAARVVVVDDGSVDETGLVAAQHGAEVIYQPNAGAAAAREAGLARVTTSFVIFLDADDQLLPEGVRSSLQLSRELNHRAIVGGVAIGVDREGNHIPFRPWSSRVDFRELLNRGYSPSPPASFLWPSQLLREALTAPTPALWPRYAEDYELLIRGAILAPIHVHGEPAVLYNLTGGKSTVVPIRSLQCSEQIRRHYADLFEIPIHQRTGRQLESRALVRAAKNESHNRISRTWLRLFLAALIRDPAFIVSLSFGAASRRLSSLVGRVRTSSFRPNQHQRMNEVRSNTGDGHRDGQGNPRVFVWKATWLPGSETFVRNQAESLRRWEAMCAGIKKCGSPVSSQDDRILFTETVHDRIQRFVFITRRRSRRLDDELIEGKFDLIHAHFLPDAILIKPTAERLGIPLIVTVHGHDVTAVQTLYARSRDRKRAEEALRHASRVVAVSEFIAERVVSLGADEAKVVVHHIGVPREASSSSHEQVPIRDVVFVGRLVEKKGVDDLLRAVAVVEASLGRAVSVCIVGSGRLEHRLRALSCQLGLTVDFRGSVSPSEVQSYMHSARIFVAPSKTAADGDSEGLPMVFLEAGRAGIPVVAYRHGGVGEAVLDGVTGLLAPEGNVAVLAACIERLLGDPDLAMSMGRAGRDNVSERFDIATQTTALENLYDDVMDLAGTDT